MIHRSFASIFAAILASIFLPFLGILMLGFLYIWGKGGLEWE